MNGCSAVYVNAGYDAESQRAGLSFKKCAANSMFFKPICLSNFYSG